MAVALSDKSNELWLSPISVWEFLLLAERGRIRLGDGMSPRSWLEASQLAAPMHDAPLTRAVAIQSRSVGLAHEDPADRFIAATAAVYDLTLVTADTRLLRGHDYRTLTHP